RVTALAKVGFAHRSQSAGRYGEAARSAGAGRVGGRCRGQRQTLSGFPSKTALAKVGFAHRSQSAGRYGNPLRVSIKDRVGEGGLCPPEPERGKVWKPSQGFHQRLEREVGAASGRRVVRLHGGEDGSSKVERQAPVERWNCRIGRIAGHLTPE